MNDSTKCANGLLVLKLAGQASDATLQDLTEMIRPTADALGVEPMVVPSDVEVELKMGSAAVLERLCVAVERLVQQGEPPTAPEQELNARPTGLNSRG